MSEKSFRKASSLILSLDDEGHCIECGDPSAVEYGWWEKTNHVCNCDKCGNDGEDLFYVHYCADCAVQLGFALEAREVADLCGYAPSGLDAQCLFNKVKSFRHEDKWWVLVTEVLPDDSPLL